MKILINTPSLELPGGVAYYYKTIKPYFQAEVSYFTIGKRKGNRSRYKALYQLLKDYFYFVAAVCTSHYDLVHLNPSLGSRSFVRDALFIGLAKLCRKRVIVFFRGWDEDYEVFARKYLLWLYKLTYFRVEAIIVLADEFKTKLEKLGYKGKIFVETTVVDDEVFTEYSLDERDYNKDVVNILFLSRIEKAKGIYELIDAVKILNVSHDNIVLTIAGSGEDRQAAEDYANECGLTNIEFTGFVSGDDKKHVFKQADIFAFPTYYGEGMPNAVLEAMAYGLPVLTRPVGGLGDFFENDRMGFLVDEIDAKIYANCLEKLVADEELRSSISRYNRDYANQNFKATNVVRRLERIYSELVR